MSTLLRAHVSDGQVDQALADMAALEKAGGAGAGGSLTQLYFSLGKLLQKEMDRLKQTGNSVGLNKTQQAYQKFLSALASSKTGQTYDSLQWAGENMLTLNNAKEAADVFNRILATFGQDQAFLAQPGGNTRILRTRLKLAAALRGQRDFTAAEALVDELLKENPGAFKPIMVEKAQLSEDMAMAGSGNWNVAYNRWEKLARKLEQMRPKPIEYFDAWYHAALALSMEKQDDEGQADPRQRDAALPHRRRAGDEGQVRRAALEAPMTPEPRTPGFKTIDNVVSPCVAWRSDPLPPHGGGQGIPPDLQRVTALSNEMPRASRNPRRCHAACSWPSR